MNELDRLWAAHESKKLELLAQNLPDEQFCYLMMAYAMGLGIYRPTEEPEDPEITVPYDAEYRLLRRIKADPVQRREYEQGLMEGVKVRAKQGLHIEPSIQAEYREIAIKMAKEVGH